MGGVVVLVSAAVSESAVATTVTMGFQESAAAAAFSEALAEAEAAAAPIVVAFEAVKLPRFSSAHSIEARA